MSVYLNQNLESLIFKAVLKDPNGGEEFEGRAEINLEEQYIDFKGEFVPLYPLGSCMEIYRIYGKREIHRFRGQVYLSDTNLMRLIKVTDNPLPSALDVCCTGITFPASVTITYITDANPSGFFRKKKKESETYSATLTAMTQAQIEFILERSEPFEEGQELSFSVLEPALFSNTPVTVRKVFTYGDCSSYLCAIGNESSSQAQFRAKYLQENQLKPKSFFSPQNNINT